MCVKTKLKNFSFIGFYQHPYLLGIHAFSYFRVFCTKSIYLWIIVSSENFLCWETPKNECFWSLLKIRDLANKPASRPSPISSIYELLNLWIQHQLTKIPFFLSKSTWNWQVLDFTLQKTQSIKCRRYLTIYVWLFMTYLVQFLLIPLFHAFSRLQFDPFSPFNNSEIEFPNIVTLGKSSWHGIMILVNLACPLLNFESKFPIWWSFPL